MDKNKFKTSRYKKGFYSHVFPNIDKDTKNLIKFLNHCQEKSLKYK